MSDLYKRLKVVTDELHAFNTCYDAEADTKSCGFTGSVMTSHWNPDTSDIDVVAVYNGRFSTALCQVGFKMSMRGDGTSPEYANEEISACLRNGRLNVILVKSQHDFEQWMLATDVLEAFDLPDRKHRAQLFQLITEGKVRGTPIRVSVIRQDIKGTVPVPEDDDNDGFDGLD